MQKGRPSSGEEGTATERVPDTSLVQIRGLVGDNTFDLVWLWG